VIDAMARHEIQVLRAAGIPGHAVAKRTAVSVRSVERISKEPGVTGMIRTSGSGDHRSPRDGRSAGQPGWPRIAICPAWTSRPDSRGGS